MTEAKCQLDEDPNARRIPARHEPHPATGQW
jgi:hypothetical protein